MGGSERKPSSEDSGSSGRPGSPGSSERVGAGALYGSLEMLILKTLRHGGAMHGLRISERIAALSGEEIQIEVGALYPALHRMQRRGLLRSEWRKSEQGRRAKFYDLTPAGEAALADEIRSWRERTRAIDRLFAALEGGALQQSGA